MRIAIAGAGLAGSYIYRLLSLRGFCSVDLFDIRHRIACGIHPCGYAVDERFNELAGRVGLKPASYVLHVPPQFRAKVEGVSVRTSIFMIDKPRLIRDLLGSKRVRYEVVDVASYDLVIDATGAARAYAPPLTNDLKARVVQWRVRVRQPAETAFLPTRGVPGYAWVMPLREDGTELHVGAGCGTGVAAPARSLTRPAFGPLQVEDVVCACGGRIRLSGPEFDRVVHGNIWAVGEAAGLVGPASGAGNVYAMQSGLALVDNLHDRFAYVDELKKQFSSLVPEARAVRRIINGGWPSPIDLYHIRRGWAMAGVHVSWRDMPRLAFAMGRAYLEPPAHGQNELVFRRSSRPKH